MSGTLQPPVNAEGQANSLKSMGGKMLGNSLNYGFIGIDSLMRIREGESAPVAVGKALLTNAAFSLLPGGIIGGMAIMGAAAIPGMMTSLDHATAGLDKKKSQFGGNFQQSEAQLGLLQNGLNKMSSASMHANKVMANHARGATKVY